MKVRDEYHALVIIANELTKLISTSHLDRYDIDCGLEEIDKLAKEWNIPFSLSLQKDVIDRCRKEIDPHWDTSSTWCGDWDYWNDSGCSY